VPLDEDCFEDSARDAELDFVEGFRYGQNFSLLLRLSYISPTCYQSHYQVKHASELKRICKVSCLPCFI
jgi:hypothetical protein